MERYAPNAKDLASRDVVSRSMTIEIREGRYGLDMRVIILAHKNYHSLLGFLIFLVARLKPLSGMLLLLIMFDSCLT